MYSLVENVLYHERKTLFFSKVPQRNHRRGLGIFILAFAAYLGLDLSSKTSWEAPPNSTNYLLMVFPKLSLLLNILVLIPVCSGIYLKSSWTLRSYGTDTPAQRILLSIYLAILISSAILIFKFDPKFVMALLTVQIIYKLLSPFMVGSFTNPVIISNIFIALFHMVSVWKLSR